MKRRDVTEIGKPYKKDLTGERLPMSAQGNEYVAWVDVAVFAPLTDDHLRFIKNNIDRVEHEKISQMFHVLTIRSNTGTFSHAKMNVIKTVLHMCGFRYDENVHKTDPLRRDMVMWDSVGESKKVKDARFDAYCAAYAATLDVWVVEAFVANCDTPYVTSVCYGKKDAERCKQQWEHMTDEGERVVVKPAGWIKNHPALAG